MAEAAPESNCSEKLSGFLSFSHTSGEPAETPLQKVFNALCTNANAAVVSANFLIDFLADNGLERGDPRLTSFFQKLENLPDGQLDWHKFEQACSDCSTLIWSAICDNLVAKDFASVREIVKEVYDVVINNEGGNNASYIPQLAKVDPDQFAISITTVDGQHFSIGDSDTQFCIQSCCKPLNYLLARRCFQDKPGYVHDCVGKEPSGRKFNEMTLKSVGPVVHGGGEGESSGRRIPHNPMINAGAIMCTSMVHPNLRPELRLEEVLKFWRSLCAVPQSETEMKESERQIRVDWETYHSESRTANRNRCLSFMMSEDNSWPECFNGIEETLKLYFETCSILNTNRNMAHMAATLAHGGINPLSQEKVVDEGFIRNVLPLMLTCGMYDYSGEWVYDVGVPAKSGVGGCVFMVVPNVCGISVWSPRLDENGNSVRGVHVAKELVSKLVMHAYEVSSAWNQKKIDMRFTKNTNKIRRINALLFAASNGDWRKVKEAIDSGVNAFEGDYDDRTPLHIAVCEGRVKVVRLLAEHAKRDPKKINATDRWGGTPLDDALMFKRDEIATILKYNGGVQGKHNSHNLETQGEMEMEPSLEAPFVLYAAAENDIKQLVKISASDSFGLRCCDYDLRTPLHLAAANDQHEAINYILAQCGEDLKYIKDRWGNTPVDDAKPGSPLRPAKNDNHEEGHGEE